MRYPNAHKQASHEKILEAAGKLFRAHGVASTGIDAVMSAVGLTPGGFYNHFKSKQALVAEMVRKTIGENREKLIGGLAGMPKEEWVEAFTRRYLSRAHRDTPETGCPIAALASELPHLAEVTPVLAGELETYVALLEKKLGAKKGVTSRQRALAYLATLVGGMALARALKGSPLSDEILLACRDAR